MRYRQEIDGEWFRPRMKNWYMRCCDCGLVHKVNFRVTDDGQVEMMVERVKKRGR